MNKLAYLLCLLIASTFAVARDVSPRIVSTNFNTGYIPIGFDTNDKIQFVAEGQFHNGCYKPAEVRKEVSKLNKTIHLYPQAYYYDGPCFQMFFTYPKDIDLGLLDVDGDYKVYSVTGNVVSPLGTLPIVKARNNSPDDYLYAPVSQAYYEKIDGKSYVTISGRFDESCYSIQAVDVDVQSNVIVVQPKAEKIDAPCDLGEKPYLRRVEVPQAKKARYLLHVRALNGKAVNTLIDVE